MQKGARRSVSAVGRSPGSLSIVSIVSIKTFVASGTHTVKQSYIKLSAAGPTTVLTSSGIGGARFSDPSL